MTDVHVVCVAAEVSNPSWKACNLRSGLIQGLMTNKASQVSSGSLEMHRFVYYPPFEQHGFGIWIMYDVSSV